MPIDHRIVASLITCTLLPATAGCTSTQSIRLNTSTAAPGVSVAAAEFGITKPTAPHNGGAPRTGSTQTDADEIRRRVKEGQKIVILDDQGRKLTGRIGGLGADALMLDMRGGRSDVPYNRILRIDRPHDGFSNGALIGLGTGAALGLVGALAAAMDDSGWGSPDPADVARTAPLVLGGIGAVIGLGLDAAIRHEPNLYSREGGTRVSVSPALGRGRQGVAVSVSW